tara:strand:+ start:27 stop:575 length:549 start_codon:yes stop_codon:yes gene_type:complete
MADQRDTTTWVILELSRLGEQKAEDGSLVESLLRHLRVEDLEVFVPAATYKKGGRTVTIHLMEGYAFVASGLEETTYFGLEHKPDVKSVMSSTSPSGIRVPHTLPQKEIQRMQDQLRTLIIGDVEIGHCVSITDGTYQGLEGRVLDLEKDYAILKIEMRSLAVITKIPQVFLEVEADEMCGG